MNQGKLTYRVNNALIPPTLDNSSDRQFSLRVEIPLASETKTHLVAGHFCGTIVVSFEGCFKLLAAKYKCALMTYQLCAFGRVKTVGIKYLYPEMIERNSLSLETAIVFCPFLKWSQSRLIYFKWQCYMMTSSNGSIFLVTVPLCGKSPVTGEFPSQMPEARSYDVSFHLRLNKRLSTQSRRWWFETPSRSLWRHCNEIYVCEAIRCSDNGFWLNRHQAITSTNAH